ncbi:MAG: hypothetical protein JSW06_07200 [Thermoplasmatales archaeon]|nr:MAG: hypothetical protein JSW06_07200 [Thermoplasmatales archaeon]
MKKKILLGSIGAVVILVLVSFVGVVGYSNVESNVKASPLFNLRTNRKIGEESKDLTCKYVNKDLTIPFPNNDKRALIKKIIELSNKGDDWTIEIEVKGGLLGYKVTLRNIGNETVNGSLIMNITTNSLFMIVGRKVGFEPTDWHAEQLAPGEEILRNLRPLLGFGPAVITIEGVFNKVGMGTWDDCPNIPFELESKGFVLLFYPFVKFEPIATSWDTSHS